MFNMFKKKIEIPIHSKWLLRDDKSPWESNCRQKVTVTDVKKGWVRYDFDGPSIWKNQRLEVSSFLYCYERVD